jgi:RNA polymerase sigma-70 factor (ECF subfamily)
VRCGGRRVRFRRRPGVLLGCHLLRRDVRVYVLASAEVRAHAVSKGAAARDSGYFLSMPVKPSTPPAEPSTRSGAGPSDAALVVAARAGESWAREALFRRYAPLVNGLAFRLMGRDEDVDDLVQDSFVEALRSLGRLDAPQAFASWLSSIVVRTCGKLLRRRQLMRRLGLRRAGDAIDLDALVSPTAPPDVIAELSAIYGLVGGLPPNVRVALILRRVEGHSLDEIAGLTGASYATIKRRVAEGERLLEEELVASGRPNERSRP